MLLFGFPTTASANELHRISVGVSVSEDGGRVRVSVELPEGVSLCGILAELSYDGSGLAFLSDEASFDGEGFSFADLGDAVRFVADGRENRLQGRIAELVFETKNAVTDSVSFTLSVREAYFFDDKGSPVPVLVMGETLTARIGTRRRGVFLSGVSTRNAEGITRVELYGEIAEWRIAAGFEITVFDPVTGETDRYSAAVTPRLAENGTWGFTYSIGIPSVGAACIAVCPLTYSRSGAELGRSEMLTFYNGKLISKTQIN